MATASFGSQTDGAAPRLQTAFEPAAKKLGSICMALTDLGCSLRRVVSETAPRALGDHVQTLQSELKRMDELVFHSIEVMDDLFTLVRDDLAGRAERANGVLAVNALDAYLEGAATLPTPMVHRGVQTDDRMTGAAVVTPAPSPMAVHIKPSQMSSIQMFDLLRGLHRRQEVKPKMETETDRTVSPASKKRARSPTPTDARVGRASQESEGHHRTATHDIQKRRPIAIHGVRGPPAQREYAVEFEGLDEHVWLLTRRAPPAAKAMIETYARAQRKKREREKRHALAATATSSEPMESDDASSDAEGIYIVEKIVEHRFRYGKKQYLVKWDGYDTDENTWEPAAKLRSEVRSIVDDYERDLAKAAGQLTREEGTAKTGPSKAIGQKSSASGHGKTKPVALGRPSNPSALTKSTPGSAYLLQRSGKIPKVQFLISNSDTDDDDDEDPEDSDVERRARSDEEDDEDGDEDDSGDAGKGSFAGKGYGYKRASLGKQRRTGELSPYIE